MKTAICLEEKSGEVESIELEIEELEPIVAPGMKGPNHNETVVSEEEIELEIDELEPIVAPGVSFQHNETVVTEEFQLEAKKLEEIVSPGIGGNPATGS